MKLLSLCEPLFLYVCRLNRSAGRDARLEHGAVRGQVEQIFAEMRQKAQADAALARQFGKEAGQGQLELVLKFFVDYMINESQLSFASEWRPLAYEDDEMAGDEKFFDMLEEELASGGSESAERLAVYYVCLGLGFGGWYADQPEYLHQKMVEIAGRIREQMDADEQSLVCPEAYESVDTSNLVEPPGKSLWMIGVALVGLTVVLLVGNVYLYSASTQQLNDSLERLEQLEGG